MNIMHGFPKIVFEFGAVKSLPEELEALGIKRPLIITDKGLVEHGVLDFVRNALDGRNDFALFDDIPENPTIAGVVAALEVYNANDCDGIVALGGGSVLDSGKALRVAATHDGPIIDYLLDASKITKNVAPYITVPTTAGTGAEITFGGGIHPDTNAHSLGIRSVHVKPDTAICDPELTLTLPPLLTAATGMDALGHAIEGVLSNQFNPPVEAIALDAIWRVAAFIERAVADGNDIEARSEMQMAALEGGMAIYMGLGPMHALANAFGDSPLHHGTLVTVSAPAVMRFYENHLDEKLTLIHAAMGLDDGMDIATGIEALNERIGMPASVREMGYDGSDLDTLTQVTIDSHFNAAAPVLPTDEEYRKIVEEVLG
ncbi:MAG: iron-containing alcohol dehydrogenase [Rhodospirillaceae bacterium]|nr:iron-containing alcohol dehydrogenase [Rhodospirillaceae bacterium]